MALANIVFTDIAIGFRCDLVILANPSLARVRILLVQPVTAIIRISISQFGEQLAHRAKQPGTP